VENALRVLGQICQSHRISALDDFIEGSWTFAQEQILNVAVLGRFKAAKSSFFNHLLGRRTMMRCEECDRPVRSLFMADKTGEASPE
jgi:predicted GTPase